MSFQNYESRPVTRQAYEIQRGDEIKTDSVTDMYGLRIDGEFIKFTANAQIYAGDFIVYISDHDIYHCPRNVFLERNHVSQAPTKTLHNSDISGARKNVRDIAVVGNGDLFQLLAKASSEAEGWMKSTKAMDTGIGCLVQVTTQQRNPDGSYSIAEALTFVPDVVVIEDTNGGRHLEPV